MGPEASLPHVAACISMGRLALLSENKAKVSDQDSNCPRIMEMCVADKTQQQGGLELETPVSFQRFMCLVKQEGI